MRRIIFALPALLCAACDPALCQAPEELASGARQRDGPRRRRSRLSCARPTWSI